MPNTKLEKNESFPDLSVWDFEKCLISERADSNQKEEGLLLRTLTGHGGLVHNIFATSFGLISCDITGLIFERDFWKCIQVSTTDFIHLNLHNHISTFMTTSMAVRIKSFHNCKIM